MGLELPKRSLVRVWLLSAVAAAVVLLCAPAALADSIDSSNWSGYAVHRQGVSYHKVVGRWVEPGATCVPGRQSFSSFWVGLGGYSQSSSALEQVGTEVDCTRSGLLSSSAWYELVPAPSIPFDLNVSPGDQLSATVTVDGHRVVVALSDLTRHTGFSKVLNAGPVDISSAEWIAEAPSDCVTPTACQTLPLADFGSAPFGSAFAQSTDGHAGAITDPRWRWTNIRLVPEGRRFVINNGSGSAIGAATASPLRSDGTAFTVSYTLLPIHGNPLAALDARVPAGYLVHPGR